MALVIALTKDLLFREKIGLVCREFAVEVRFIRDIAKLAAIEGPIQLLLLDVELLIQLKGDQTDISRVVADCANRSVAMVGYYSHIHPDAAQFATEIGIEAMPRSKFVMKLPFLVQSLNT